MQDEFLNRLEMFRTARGTLNSAEHKPTWLNQDPTAFTTKEAEMEAALADLELFCSQYGADITGAAKDKAREKKELEDEAFELGSALTEWFLDQNDETSAEQVNLTISAWRKLRDHDLVGTAKLLRDLAQAVVSGAQSAAAATYGVTAAAVTALSAEIADYDAVLTAPQQKIAGKRAGTLQFRTRFNAMEAKFESLDRLIHKFSGTQAGRNLIAAYFASRINRDRGAGPGTPPPTPTQPSP